MWVTPFCQKSDLDACKVRDGVTRLPPFHRERGGGGGGVLCISDVRRWRRGGVRLWKICEDVINMVPKDKTYSIMKHTV